MKVLIFVGLCAALVASLLAINVGGFLTHWFQPYPLANAITLRSVSLVTNDDGWAVGVVAGAPNCVVMHRSNGHWEVEAKPSGLSDLAVLTSVAMVSAHDGWATAFDDVPASDRSGHVLVTSSVLLRYQGDHWQVSGASVRARLNSLSVVSASDIWAAGADGLLLHFNGSTWTEVTVPADLHMAYFTAIAARPGGDVWVAAQSILLHHTDTGWTETYLDGRVAIQGLAMVSEQDVWAVGSVRNGSERRGVIFHYLGDQWIIDAAQPNAALNSIAMAGGGGWAVGDKGVLLRRIGDTWKQIQSPPSSNQRLQSVAAVSGQNAWAVGDLGTIVHAQQGTSSVDTNVRWQPVAWQQHH